MQRLIALALILATLAFPARAEVRAVLVGVGTYDHLDADLRGPPHDVALMAEALMRRGLPPERIAALTTGPDLLPPAISAAPPTRDAILAALASAATGADAGDTILFYFSGHGSEAPDRDGDEVTGADQILLPADAKGWRGAVGDVENAIYDDELQAWARPLLARGVRIVGIIDACHSGTAFRAAAGAGVARNIDPAALGIPEDLPPALHVPPPPLTGDFAFLYSSQSDQRSFEFPLDPARPDGPWHGAFTLALSQSLTEAPGATWGQTLTLARDRMTRGTVRQDPDGEGPLLDAPTFGIADLPTPRLRVADGALAAGLLDGLSEGDEVALFADPSGGAMLGQARLAALTASAARLDPAPPQDAAWAEVTAPAPPPPLRLAAPERADAGDGADYATWLDALAAAMADGLAVADAAPDLVPILSGGLVALAGADGMLDPEGPGSTPRILPRPGETEAEATFRTLEAAAHALRLRAVLAGMTGRALTPGATIAMTVERRVGQPGAQGCTGRAAAPGTPHDPAAGVAPCDELWLTLTNRTGRSQDVTLFYRAQDFTLTPIWPPSNLSARLPLGATARAGLRIEPDSLPGAIEEILVVAVASDLRAQATPLSGLATPDRLRATGGSGEAIDTIARLLDPEAGTTRTFTARRPDLTLLRQTVRLFPPTQTTDQGPTP